MILRHLRAHFGSKIIVLESKIRVLSENKYIEPICGKVKIDRRMIHHWYKDVHTVVLKEFEIVVFELKKFDVLYFNDKKINVAISSDKGQEKF